MQKGTYIIAKGEKHTYRVAGLWGNDIVLAPVNDDDDQVLIYNATELETLISERYFNKLLKIDMEKRINELLGRFDNVK